MAQTKFFVGVQGINKKKGSFIPKIRFLGQKVCFVARRQTHRETDTQTKWIQRTPFQDFRNFSFNLSTEFCFQKINFQYQGIICSKYIKNRITIQKKSKKCIFWRKFEFQGQTQNNFQYFLLTLLLGNELVMKHVHF